jgi:hypothetical protein
VVVQITLILGIIAFLALPVPALIAGFIRLRGWRRRNWLRAAAWAGAWIAGIGLSELAGVWGEYPLHSCPHLPPGGIPPQCPYGSPAVVSWGELPVCAALLLVGAVMTWILAAPAPPRARRVPDKTVTGA